MKIIGFNKFGDITVIIEGEVATVPNDLSNRHRQMIAEWEDRGNTIPPYVDPEPEEQPYRLYKSVFINRLTDNEAVTMEAVLENSPAKLRLMFNSVEYFNSNDPLFETLYNVVSSALTQKRANELLSEGNE